MQVQPIANLEQRLHHYSKSKSYWLTREIPLFLVSGCIISLIMSYFAASLEPSMQEYWVVKGLVIGCIIASAPIAMQRPKKPTQANVDEDVALRKSFDMDATVSDFVPTNEH